jgi:hypothetical protein
LIKPTWAAERDFGVFINCPFDKSYRKKLDAIVFTSVQAGFVPWMAGSTGDVAVSRVERIFEGLQACRYSVHDLTRYRGAGPGNLSRFNMPLELGMAMAVRQTRAEDDRHDWMFMVPVGHIYQRYISDLSGFDPRTHNGTAEGVALAVFFWLTTRNTATPGVGPADLLRKLPAFSRRKKELDESWGDQAPWRNVIELAVEVARA